MTNHKKAQGYEQYPPRCRNCTYFNPAQTANPEEHRNGKLLRPAVPFIPSTCMYPVKELDGNSFAVNPQGICDKWVHVVTKETLETS